MSSKEIFKNWQEIEKKCVILQRGTLKIENMEQNDTMIAAEPVATYGTNSYADVMMMLYSMPITPEVKEHVGHRLVLEVTGKNLSRAIARIDHLAHLGKDWDGCGASRILPSVVSNIRAVILSSKDADWSNWTISPNVNGTLFLQSTKYISSLSLGEHEYSFFTKKDGQREGGSHIPFSVDGFLTTMRTLNQ